MNYQESEEIKNKIDSSNKFLVNMHHNPDADSVGSAVSVARVLKHFGKEVKILSSTEVPKNLHFLFGEEIPEIVNFSQFNFSEYDVFITCDSSSFSRVCGDSNLEKPDIFFINIDHHISNQKFGDINLVVPDAAANCEVLYYLFQDLGVIPDVEKDYPDIHNPLLAGIIGDTGAFRFPEADIGTFGVASELMKMADKNKIIFNLYQSFEESHVMVWKEILDNIAIDNEYKFVYSFVKKGFLEQYGKPFNAKSELADMIFQSIDGTDFGMVGAEDDGYISVSFRSRTGLDVSKLASHLGGGGHAWASAARVDIIDGSYEKTVEEIISKVRDYVSKLQV